MQGVYLQEDIRKNDIDRSRETDANRRERQRTRYKRRSEKMRDTVENKSGRASSALPSA